MRTGDFEDRYYEVILRPKSSKSCPQCRCPQSRLSSMSHRGKNKTVKEKTKETKVLVYLSKLQKFFIQIERYLIFKKISRHVYCHNYFRLPLTEKKIMIYLSKWQIRFVSILKYICPNCQRHVSKLQKVRQNSNTISFVSVIVSPS